MILPGNSFQASRPVAALDRFILRGRVGHVSGHVRRSSLAAQASDHLPQGFAENGKEFAERSVTVNSNAAEAAVAAGDSAEVDASSSDQKPNVAWRPFEHQRMRVKKGRMFIC